MAGMIDFLVGRINEESNDAGVYMEWASKCTDPKIKDALNTIGKQELMYQKMLIDMLDIEKDNQISNYNQSQYILGQLGRFVAWAGTGAPAATATGS